MPMHKNFLDKLYRRKYDLERELDELDKKPISAEESGTLTHACKHTSAKDRLVLLDLLILEYVSIHSGQTCP